MKPLVVPASNEPASKQIDYVAKRLGALLKPHAFRRVSRRFNRVLMSGKSIDAVQCFNLQGSQRNFAAHGRFCINVGVWFEPLAGAWKQMKHWESPTAPEKRAPYECHFNVRIHALVPRTREPWWPKGLVPVEDSWFEVGPGEQLAALADGLVRVVESYLLPWFGQRASLEAVALGLPPAANVQRAVALALMSKGEEARALYAATANRQPEVEAWFAKR